LPQAAPTATAEKYTYDQILKSSALVGGGQAVGILIRIVRTKAMALLLGPAGFGLFGLYGSIATLTQSMLEWASTAVVYARLPKLLARATPSGSR